MLDENQPSGIKSCLLQLLFVTFVIVISILYHTKMIFVSPTMMVHLSPNQSLTNTIHEQKIRCIIRAETRMGRLANRIFYLATAYGLARLHSCHMYVAPEIIQEMKKIFLFNLSSLLLSPSVYHSITNTSSNKMTTISRYVVCQYLPELTRPNAIPPGMIYDLQGYWQSYLHFANYADELRQNVFVATQSVLLKVAKFYNVIYQKRFGSIPQFSLQDHHSFKSQLAQSNLLTWIGIHVRRSDFLSVSYSSNNEYLFFAMKYYTALYPNAYFLVATDDKSYCKRVFRNQPNVSITPYSFSPGDDLIALSFCQHSIVTGGTFGWWAAYLAHGRVVHDVVYPSGCERREYYYPPWFLIDGNVRAYVNSSYVL